jgi:hypothetical protein
MNQYQQLINRDYNFQMGRYMEEGWSIFKKAAGSFIGFTVVYLIIYFIVTIIPFVNLFAMFVAPALLAGIFIFCRNMMYRREEFKNFFEGFNFFGNIALFQLVLFLFMIPFLILIFSAVFPVSVLPDLISGDYNPEWLSEDIRQSFENNFAPVALIYLVFLAGILYLYTSYSLTLPLIVDAKMDFWEAMETSRKVVAEKFFNFLGMYIVLGLLLMVGTIFTCGLGLLVLLPYLNTVIFATYDDIFKQEGAVSSEQ